MLELCQHAVDAARSLGVDYADARILELCNQRIYTEDKRVSGVHDATSTGVGVRVIVGDAWGFSATSQLSKPDVERAVRQAVEIARSGAAAGANGRLQWADEPAHVAVHRTAIKKDPFEVSLEDKIGLLLKINERVMGVNGVSKCHSHMHFRRQHRWLCTSEGARIESDVYTSCAQYEATAVNGETAKTRYFEATPQNIGYEHIEDTPLLDEAERVGEEAVEHLSAKTCPDGKKDLVLMPSHLALTMHESIGHATELDRAIGMEESLAGSSFATPDQLGILKYGSPMMNVVADNTLPVGCASMGFDDDAVECQRYNLVREGMLAGFMCSRDTAHAMGAKRSNGSCRADSWSSIPIVRQSNFSLEPGEAPLTLDELIADTDDGILIDGMGSFSIDQKRHNFQFGGDCFWEIKNGKIVGMLKDVTYWAITTDFWGSLDATCDRRFWESIGVMNCGKGDPMQAAQMSHSTAPARFRQINVGPAGI